MFWSTLTFTISVTLPVCVMLFAGIGFKRAKVIDDHFISTSSKFVFNFCMPALLFTSVSELDVGMSFDTRLAMFVLAASVISFLMAWAISFKVVSEPRDRGVFVQGSSRGNLAIVGLALVGNMYGDEGIAGMSLLMAFLIPMYNVVSVFFLSFYAQGKGVHFSWLGLVRDILKNPLIIAVFSGLAFAASGLVLPDVVEKVIRYFSSITLPLALINIGGSLSMKALKDTSSASVWGATHKIILMPLLFLPVGWLLGFSGMELGIIYLALSCPSAAASFVMAKAVGGNAALAANIIVLTTLGALPFTSLGIFMLKYFALI